MSIESVLKIEQFKMRLRTTQHSTFKTQHCRRQQFNIAEGNNSTSAKPTILALASGKADYNIQHCLRHGFAPQAQAHSIIPALPYYKLPF